MKRSGSLQVLYMDHVDQMLVACLTEATKSLDPTRFGGLETRLFQLQQHICQPVLRSLGP